MVFPFPISSMKEAATPSVDEQISAIPRWRRLLTCWILRRRRWLLARAYNAVACEEMNRGDYGIGDKVRKRGERQWAILYGLRSPRPTLEENFEMRAIHAEFELSMERELRKRAEAKLALMKNTARGLADLRRSRPLPL